MTNAVFCGRGFFDGMSTESLKAEIKESTGGADAVPEYQSVAGGGGGSSSAPLRMMRPDQDKKLAEFRNKHMKVIEALKKNTNSPMTPNSRSLGTAPLSIVRRPGSQGSFDSDTISMPQSQVSQKTHQQHPVLQMIAEMQEEQKIVCEKLMDTVNELRQETTQEVAQLRQAIENQGEELEAVRSQDIHIALKSVKESILTNDKMDALRAQEIQVAIENLKDSLQVQGRKVEAIKSDYESFGSSLEEQTRKLGELLPQTQATQRSVIAVRDGVAGHSSKLEQLSNQLSAHHQESCDHMEEMRTRLAKQGQVTQLQEELDTCRKREVDVKKAHKAATYAWKDQHEQLQNELANLQDLESDSAGGYQKGHEGPRLLPLAIAAASGAVLVAIFGSLFQALTANPNQPHHSIHHVPSPALTGGAKPAAHPDGHTPSVPIPVGPAPARKAVCPLRKVKRWVLAGATRFRDRRR